MKRKLALSGLILLTASALVVLTASAAGVYEVDWWTVDGGGATFSDGGSYSLGGTIGQPDAGSAMNGGAYSLTGGFLAGISAGSAPPAFVTISGNTGAEGVTLSYSDPGPLTATSDAEGDYTLSVSYNWTGTVTPSLTDYLFTPDHRDYANLTANDPDEDYAAVKQTPTILTVYPAPLSTSCQKPQVGVQLLLGALVRLPSGAFNPATVTLRLDNVNRTSQATIMQSASYPASHATIVYTPPSNLAAGSHMGTFIYPSPDGPVTYDWNFTAAGITCLTAAPSDEPLSDQSMGNMQFAP